MSPAEPYVVLIPAWGALYVEQALKFSVPSMFAENNIPALAETRDVHIVFLTDAASISTITAHPFAKVIERHCALECIDISDIIYPENYGVTLTLAYAYGIMKTQEKFDKVVIVFSNSDMIFSNGSFEYIARTLDEGFDGIATTGVRSVEEFAQRSIEGKIRSDGILSIDSDFLADLALRHAHPTDLASTLSNGEYFHEAANHFFIGDWESAVVGFWFLRAMLAIRPRKSLKSAFSFCDYSFLPYLVDEERIARPSDCHELFMFELSAKDQEAHYIKPGSIPLTSKMDSVRKFANAHHRVNGRTPYYLYRRKDVGLLPGLKEQFDTTIAEVDGILGERVKPVHGHPYWNSAIASLIFHGKTFPEWVDYDRNVVHALQSVFTGKTVIDGRRRYLGIGRRLVGRIPLVRDFGLDPAAKWLVLCKERCGHVYVVSSFESFVRAISTDIGMHRKFIFLQTFGQFYERAAILDEPQKVNGAFIFFGLLEDWKIVFNELTERECILGAEVSETRLSADIVLAVASNTNLQGPKTFPIKELLDFAPYRPATGSRESAG